MQPEIAIEVIGEPVIELTADELIALEEAAHEAKVTRLMQMKALALRLSGERDELIKAKRPIDQMALDSLRLYRGDECWDDATKDHPIGSNTGGVSKRPKLLRARTDRWEARMSEMLSANPWNLKPDLDQNLKDQDPELEMRAQRACDGMELTIRNQFEGCKLDQSIRKICRDAARIGNGLLMGPRKGVKTKRKYAPPMQDPNAPPTPSKMVAEESIVPEYEAGDFFCFFPDMTDSIAKCEKAWYVYFMGRMEVKNLAPGFDELQINALLHSDPDIGSELRSTLQLRMQYLNHADIYKDKYAVWRYTGILNRKDLELLELCGCDVGSDELGYAEPPEMAMADLWICQDFILRAKLAPIPDDFRIPYYLFAPFRIDGSMFGMSLPMLGAGSNHVAAAAWLMAQHNQSVSSGPFMILRNGKMKPADGQWNVRGPKVMLTTDDTPMADLMSINNIPNEVEGALLIFDRAIAMMDEELNTSQWASPEVAEEHETASGLAMIFNVRSIMQGMVAAAADDEIFEPVITRSVWWNNDNNADESIKGDYLVEPLVQSERLVKDVRTQQMMAFTQMVADPRFEGMVDNRKLLEMNVSNLDGPLVDLIVPQAEYEANMQNKPPDPAALQAQYLQTRAATEQAKAQRELIEAETEKVKQQIAMLELQAAQNPQAPDNSEAMTELQLRQRELDLKDKSIDANLSIAQERAAASRESTAVKARQAEIEGQQFAYEKQQDRQNRLTTEAMKIQRDAQEMALKRQTGSGI